MITIRRQAARRTLMPPLAQCPGRVRSAETGLRRTIWVDLNQLATSVRSFVFQPGEKGTPPDIINRLGEHSACQTFNVQIFNDNRAVVIDEFARFFVVKISALISDVNVGALEQLHRFPATVRAALAPRNLALCDSQMLLRLSIPAWIVNLPSVRERGECQQANINADTFRAHGQRLRFTLNGETRKPSSGFTLDREGLNLSFNLTMKFDFDLADFREAEMRTLQREAELRIGERVITGARTEARKSCLSLALHAPKERLERLINSMQRVLENLRIDTVQLWTRFFDLNQLRALSGEVDAFTIDAPRITPLLQSRVIEFLTRRKRTFKQSYLRLRRVYPVLKSLSHSLNRNDEYHSFFNLNYRANSAMRLISP